MPQVSRTTPAIQRTISSSTSSPSGQAHELAQQRADGRGVRLAPGLLHDLPREEPDRLDLARLDIGDGRRIGVDDRVSRPSATRRCRYST